MSDMKEYILPFTAEEVEEKLNKIYENENLNVWDLIDKKACMLKNCSLTHIINGEEAILQTGLSGSTTIYNAIVPSPVDPMNPEEGVITVAVDAIYLYKYYYLLGTNQYLRFEITNTLDSKQDKFATISTKDDGRNTKIIKIDSAYPIFKTGDVVEFNLCPTEAGINTPFIVGEPEWEEHAATKRYVDAQIGGIETALENINTKQEFFADGDGITVANNTEYITEEEITNLTIVYPDSDFICSFNFTLASEGDITITLPESKYIGGIPSFANGETWELNIKNGIVVGGLVE